MSSQSRVSSEVVECDDYHVAYPNNPEDLPRVELDQAHSPFKALAHEDLIRSFVEGKEIRPIHMRIGIMGACNMRCNFCNFHSPREGGFYDLFSYKDHLPTEAAKRLLRQFAASGGRAVTFCGSGECTIHPGYVEICRDAHAQGLRIGLITNGTKLHVPELADCIAQTHTWVRVGLNAGTPETFARITNYDGAAFGTILGSMRGLREAAVDPQFRIGLNYVVTLDNYLEIDDAARAARESGAHYIRFEPEFYSASGHATIEEVMAHVNRSLAAAATLATSTFEVSIPKLDRGPMDQVEAVEGDFSRCHYSRFVTAVGADGHLYPCPQVHLNSRYRIGNVVEKGYLPVLEGGPRRDWEASNPLRTDLCKSCFYRPQNELLEWLHRGNLDLEETLVRYALEVPEPLHAMFV